MNKVYCPNCGEEQVTDEQKRYVAIFGVCLEEDRKEDVVA